MNNTAHKVKKDRIGRGFFAKYAKKPDGVIRGFDVKNRRVKITCIVISVICGIIAIVSLFPALWVFLAGFKTLDEFNSNPTLLPVFESWEDFTTRLGYFGDTWEMFGFFKYYINSFIMVAGAALCAVVFNGLMAYALAIIKPRGYKIVNGLVLWSLLIPSATSIVALFVNITRISNTVGLRGSFLWLWLAYGANAFYVILFRQFFEDIPKELREAAMLDGCSELQVFYKIIMPMSKPIIMVIVIFAVTAAWSDFLLPYLVLRGTEKETVMVKLFSFKDTKRVQLVDQIRAIFFSLLPPAVLFMIFQRRITDSAAAGSVKG